MKIQTKDLEKSQIEITVELSLEEFKPYIKKGTIKVSKEVKVEGFRPGKAPYEVLAKKVGEIAILEAAAREAINQTIVEVFKKIQGKTPIGDPQVNITKLAPNNPLEYKITVAVLPEVKLGQYKDLGIKAKKVEVSEEEVEKTIADLREARAREVIADREVRQGDKVIVDIDMFLDKVPIEGGQGREVTIVIGKGQVVPGFDKKLLGAKKGDTREFSLPYPKDFHDANLAGKLVEFRVKIKEIYERILPELDDNFAKGFGFNNLADLKENVKKTILADKKKKAREAEELEIFDKILADSRFGDIPEFLLNNEVRAMIAELKREVEAQGAKFSDYLSHLKKTEEQLMLDLSPEAVRRIKVILTILEIAKKENIKVSDEEVEKEQKALVERYQHDKRLVEYLQSPQYKNELRQSLVNRQVIEKLREWNVRQ